MCDTVLEQRPDRLPMSRACAVLGLNRSSVYRRRKASVARLLRRSRKEAVQPRALSEQEREHIIELLRRATYCDQPPAKVFINGYSKRIDAWVL